MISVTQITIYTCDRCGLISKHDDYLGSIFYGDPNKLKIDFQLRQPCLPLDHRDGTTHFWSEFFGNHFCSKCVEIVQPLFIKTRNEILEIKEKKV